MFSDNTNNTPPAKLHSPRLSPQDKTIAFKNADGELSSAFKVDSAVVSGRKVMLTGWATPNCALQIWQGDQKLPSAITRNTRPDITRKLNLENDSSRLGFTIIARVIIASPQNIDLHVQIMRTGRGQPVDHVYTINLLNSPVLSSSRPKLGAVAIGGLTEAKYSEVTGDLLVAGWLLATSDAEVWLENEAGEEFSLDGAYRYFQPERADAHAAQFGRHAVNAGLMHRLPDAPFSTQLHLMMSDGEEIRVLSTCPVSPMAVDPVEAARWLTEFPVSNHTLYNRFAQIDLPLINPLIAKKCYDLANLPVERRVLGPLPAAPLLSLVIPLYGRADLVEHQLMQFARDFWFKEHVEIIYVVDDVSLLESFPTQAEQWYRLYKLPFQWIWGSLNRGFAGANNLGAQFAKADILLFMHSDVLPTEANWVPAIVAALEQNPAMGAVAPRLLYPDGALQHAGVKFIRRDDLGIWMKYRPYDGCPPEFDPNTELTVVPAVSGACIAILRSHFDQVAGWDAHYLPGEYEETDLCFKLRAAGFYIGYLPTISLTHLGGQSLQFVGKPEFRQRMTLLNAVRHQQRWTSLLECFPDSEQPVLGAR